MQEHHTHQTFTYRPNPVLARSFLICLKDQNGDLSPIGDYTVLDENEDLSLSEKKVMNLVMQLNGGNELIPLGEKTKSRLLFHCKPKAADDPRQEVIFYAYSGHGVSRENAILTLEGAHA
ncbi:MAG: hypothetical protein WC043_08805 [Pseudobdellovibrionaceae bacterium]